MNKFSLVGKIDTWSSYWPKLHACPYLSIRVLFITQPCFDHNSVDIFYVDVRDYYLSINQINLLCQTNFQILIEIGSSDKNNKFVNRLRISIFYPCVAKN